MPGNHPFMCSIENIRKIALGLADGRWDFWGSPFCLTVEVLGAIFQVLGKPRTSVLVSFWDMSPFLWKNINVVSGWWQLKYFLFFTPTTWGQIGSNLTFRIIFHMSWVQPPNGCVSFRRLYQRLPGSAEPDFHGKTCQLPGGSSQLPTIQLPIPEDGIFECLWEEEIWIFFPITSLGG